MNQEKLRKLRAEFSKTLKQVSADLGIPLTTYANYEQGTRQPTVENLKKICKYYDISADYLLDLE